MNTESYNMTPQHHEENMIVQSIKLAFDKTADEYQYIFNHYYPAHASTGFMEANQVHTYVKNLVTLFADVDNKGAFAWLEAPLPKIDKNRYPHIDAVVFIPKLKAVVFIEAKRLDAPSRKLKQMSNDLERIKLRENFDHVCKNLNFKPQHCYALYLADVWLISESKKYMPHWWSHGKFDEYSASHSSIDKHKRNKEFFTPPWDFNSQKIKYFTPNSFINYPDDDIEKTKSIGDGYCLMIGFQEV